MVELRAPNNPYDFNNIDGQSGAIKPKVFQGLLSAVANRAESQTPDRPVMEARLSRSGMTVSYPCPWCGHRHRHHADASVLSGAVSSRMQHCRDWRRLHPREVVDSVLLRLTGRA